MYKKHRDVLELDDDETSNNKAAQHVQTDTFELDISDSDTAQECVSIQQDEKRNAALFLMKATAVCKVCKGALDQLIGDFTLFRNDKVRSLGKEVRATLCQKHVELDVDLTSLFQSPSLAAPFQGLHTEFLRKKFSISNMGLLVNKLSSVFA